MKNLILILIFTFGFYTSTLAQTGTTSTPPISSGTSNKCTIITNANYNSCCTVGTGVKSFACSTYEDRRQNAPGTINSGSMPTTPVNSSVPGITDVASTPVSGSSSLNECSSIRFLSVFDVFVWIKCIIATAIIPLIFALAFMFFLWGVFKFIAASDSTKKEEGKKFIIAGMIGLFVMTSVWGIIKIVGNTFGLGTSVVPMLQTNESRKNP